MKPQKWGKEPSTEEHLMQAIREVQIACLGKQTFYKSMGFTDDPSGNNAVVACFVVCPNAMARALREKLDAFVNEFMADNGISMGNHPATM
jgi:hypothetical protein